MERISKARAFLVCIAVVLFGIGWTGETLAQGEKTKLRETIREAQGAGVPSVTLNSLLSLGYEHQVESSAMSGLVQTLTEIHRDGIPLEPFVGKIEEGLAKHVPVPVIQRALLKKREDYRYTQAVIREISRRSGKNPSVPNEYLIRLSESLSCGISKGNFSTLLEAGSTSSAWPMVATAVEIVATLEQNAFTPSVAQQIGLTGLNQNYFTPETRDFASILVTARQKGVPDGKIVSTTIEAIQNKSSTQDLASRLGVTAQETSRGPTVRGGQRGSGSSGSSRGSGSPGSHGSGPGPGGPGTGGPGSGSGPGGSGGGPGGGGSGGGGSGGGGSGSGGPGGGGSGGGGSGGGGSGGGGSGGGSGGGGPGGGGSGR